MNAINNILEKKQQRYYNLKEVSQFTGMHYNSCKNRVKKLILGKYKNTPKAISKEGVKYKIHYTVIQDFFPKRKNSRRKKSLIDFKSFTTINPLSKYKSKEIFESFIEDCKKQFPEIKLEYAIEDSYYKKGNNIHIHILSNIENFSTEFEDLIDMYFDVVSLHETHPKNIKCILEYLNKAKINY